MNRTLSLLFLLLLLSPPMAAIAEKTESVPDSVYLQEVGRKIQTASPVVSLALHRGVLYVAMPGGLSALVDELLQPVASPPGEVRRLKTVSGSLWAISSQGLYHLADETWKKVGEDLPIDLCEHMGETIVLTSQGLMQVANDRLVPLENAATRFPLERIVSYSETLYGLAHGRIVLFDGKRFEWQEVIDWGSLPSANCRDWLSLGNRVLIATDRGLGVLRGMTLATVGGEQGLPYENLTCLSTGFDGDVWIGTAWGAIRHTGDEYHYFAGQRWLPDDEVTSVACGEGTVYIGTKKGLGLIDYEPYTLQKKASYYDRHLTEWGQKRLGFTHKLEWNSEKGEWVREVSDNDVGWSTHYLAAMCFKYAVTGDPRARAEAVDFFNTLKWSEEITPIDGFPARSIWAVGEKGHQAEGGSGGFPAEWHRTPDEQWEWKGDTSSDEIDAHFYAVSIFHDLVAEGEEKERAKEHTARLASHLVDNGYFLKDVDGKPTRWGRWEPAYLQAPIGYYARGLNGLEILSFMRTAIQLTGEEKFEKAYRELQGFGYHEEVIRQKFTFPPSFVFHSDDRLAFYVYYPLLKYETDPHLRSIYRRSLERSWEIERIERIPWFNFIYGAVTGNDCEAIEAVKHLREWPLDLIGYAYRNSHRSDLQALEGYTSYCGDIRPFSPRETGPHRWTDNLMEPDGGSGGMEVVDPSGWLDAYWMGRYYGFIAAPETADPELVVVEDRNIQLGAEPYKGPPRPE